MGVVVAGRQRSLDREVAIKLLHPEYVAQQRVRSLFLDEAAVTAGLEHPNIVPVYEVGETEEGTILYVMRWVRGVPWNEVIAERSERENLDVLLKVCDAVAFAHSRGIVHRDLKPHNVMLGEYGEVVVADWGLAVAVQDGARARRLVGAEASSGTAAYMAPEMALGRIESISTGSDVYLLGGILFEILTGQRPHNGSSALACMNAAARNEIVATDVRGELMDVAKRAMATSPGDRFTSVQDFQEAVREAQSHAHSELLCRRAIDVMREAAAQSGYDGYVRAIHGFEEALGLWPENRSAMDGLIAARTAYAQRAFERQDLDLAASLVDRTESADTRLSARIRAAQQQRDSRQRVVARLRTVAALLMLAVVVTVTVAMVTIVRARNRALAAEQHAAEQRNLAMQTLETLVHEVDAQLSGRPELEPLRQVLLDHAVEGLQHVAGAVESAEELRQVSVNLAAAHEGLARIFFTVRQHDSAERHQARAVEILRQLFDDGLVDLQVVAESEMTLGDIVHNYAMGDVADAIEWYRVAIDRLTAAPDLHDDPAALDLLGEALVGIVDAMLDAGCTDSARVYAEQAVATRRRQLELLVGDGSERATAMLGLAKAHQRLGDVVYGLDDLDEAVSSYQDALDCALAASSLASQRAAARRVQGLAHFDLGHIAFTVGDTATAREQLRAAREIQLGLVAEEPFDVDFRRDLLPTILTLGDFARENEELEEAIALYREALAVAEEILQRNTSSLEAQRDLFICHNRIGDVELEMGNGMAAVAAFERGAQLSQSVAEASPDNLLAQTDVVVSWFKLGIANVELGRRAEAKQAMTSARNLLQELVDKGSIDEDSNYWGWIAEVDRILAQLNEAG